MFGIYFWVASISKDKSTIANLLKGVIFQSSRELQIYLQKQNVAVEEDHWRPFIIWISKETFNRRSALDLVRWLSHRHGFGTYIHFIEGYLNKKTYKESLKVKDRLLKLIQGTQSRAFLDTIISPSYTSAIAQSIQLSGVSGKGNNLILFEFSADDPKAVEDVSGNYSLLQATGFDVCILRSTYKGFGYKNEIHIWISTLDYENSNLMILLAYILLGHPEWKRGLIKIFSIYEEGKLDEKRENLFSLIKTGRLPISLNNIELIPYKEDDRVIKKIINRKSVDADLTVLGYRSAVLLENSDEIFSGYEDLGNMLFVNARKEKLIQ